MKKWKQSVCMLLVLTLMLTLSACGGTAAPEKSAEETPASTPPAAPAATPSEAPAATQEPIAAETEAYAGTYSFFCARFSATYVDRMYELGAVDEDIPDQYVAMPDMAGQTVTLEADGTGFLYWGENNQGPINWWKMDGDALQFQAGVAVIEGTIIGGLMTLTIDEGFTVCFAAEGADTSGIVPITLEEFASMLRKEETAASALAELPAAGVYELFAVKYKGESAYAADLEMASTLSLVEGGTGHMTFDEDAMDVTEWTVDAEAFTITMADGGVAGGRLHSGILELDLYGTGEMILLFAREGVDISGYSIN